MFWRIDGWQERYSIYRRLGRDLWLLQCTALSFWLYCCSPAELPPVCESRLLRKDPGSAAGRDEVLL